MIDTHSHIYTEEFDEDRQQVLQRAIDAGVECILLPNINEESIGRMQNLCKQYPGYAYPMLGLHPEDVKEDFQEVLGRMELLLQEPNYPYVGIGEVGLDFYWDTTFEREQTEAFRRQVQWAVQWHLPLAVHSRAAHRELVQVLREFRQEELTGIFHCFGGTLEEAHELLDFPGFVLGIGGVVTFKKSSLPEVLKEISPSRIVLETDSPYLAPVPYRGRRNESAYVVEVLKCLSSVYGMSTQELEKITNENVRRVFPCLM